MMWTVQTMMMIIIYSLPTTRKSGSDHQFFIIIYIIPNDPMDDPALNKWEHD